VSNLSSEVTQQADLISQKVDSTVFNTKTGQLEKDITAVEQTATGISQEVSSIRTEFDTEIENTKNYVLSREENLVTNGKGLLGDNTNFSEFEFDGIEVYAGAGSFFTDRQGGVIYSDEYIPVDVNTNYRFSLFAKSKTGKGKNYFGLVAYDIDKNQIRPYDYYGSKYGIYELTKDLKEGDTEIHV